MKKDIYVLEAVNIVAFFNQMTKETMDALPLKVKWNLKRAIEKMMPDVKAFEEVRDAENQKIRDVYFDDTHSESVMIPKKDNEGNPVLDENGAEVLEEGRQVKDEYLEEYQKAVGELNKKLEEILTEKNTYEYNSLNLDDYIDSIDDKVVSFETLSMIDAILQEGE